MRCARLILASLFFFESAILRRKKIGHFLEVFVVLGHVDQIVYLGVLDVFRGIVSHFLWVIVATVGKRIDTGD